MDSLVLSLGGIMVIAIFGAQFMALWTALFAVGNSALAFMAMEKGTRIQAMGCVMTSAFLVYLTYVHMHELPKF
jgi:hypothetical protein